MEAEEDDAEKKEKQARGTDAGVLDGQWDALRAKFGSRAQGWRDVPMYRSRRRTQCDRVRALGDSTSHFSPEVPRCGACLPCPIVMLH
jgi:hypothetical protein